MAYSVYVHINKINNMMYIGCTGLSVLRRWGKDGSRYKHGQNKFYNAIKEYGWNNFEHVVLSENMTKEDALNLEEYLIRKFDTVLNGYNSAYGGKTNKLSEASKQKIRENHLGVNNPNYNKNNTSERKHYSRNKKIREEINKKEYTFLPDENVFDGRKSIEFREKQKLLKSGKNNPNYNKHTWSYGIKMTEEQKQKMKDAYTIERKEKLRQSHLGKNNPQSKKVLCVTTNTIYDTIVEASKQTKISERSISLCCNNKIPSVKNYYFTFLKEGDEI